MEWNNLIEAAEYLNQELDQIKVKRLMDISENGQYYLTFWGHYSAGKSRLINNILGKSILPVQVRETTAVMTYIRYDATEYADIFFTNGKESRVSIDEIRKIYQNNEDLEHGSIEEIDHIEVFMNHPLLERGLVIVDTPGVNTIISKHQDLAVSAIELSRKIVYIMGGPLTKADENFIGQIKNSGIDMLFVRTKCDLINTDEENPMESLDKERRDLNSIYGAEAKVHFVSNLPEKLEWYKNIDELKQSLLEITDNIHEEFEQSFEQQKIIFAEKFRKTLELHLEEKENLYRGQKNEIQAKLVESEKRISAFEQIINRQSDQFESNVSRLKNDVKNNLPSLIEQSQESFRARLDAISLSKDASKNVERIYHEEIQKAIEKLQRYYHVNFDEFVSAEEKPLYDLLEDHGNEMPQSLSFRDMEQQNAMALKQYSAKLEEVKQGLILLQKEKEETYDSLEGLGTDLERNDYQEQISEIETLLSSIPREIAMVESENQPLQPSKLLKRAGQIIDLGLLLIPGTAIAAGLNTMVNTNKVAKVLKSSGTAGEVIKRVALNTKTISSMDKVRDAVFTVKNVVSKTDKITKKDKLAAEKLKNIAANKAGSAYEKFKANHGVLDMLEVAFWTEKIGGYFDKPVRMEVDQEEERQRKEYRDEIYQKKNAILEEYNRKRQEFNMNLSKQEELEKKEEDQKRILAEIERETEKKAEVLKLQAEQKVLDDFKKQYLSFFEKNLRNLSEKMMGNYFQSLSENMVVHIAQLNKTVSEDLEQEKLRLERLIADQSDKESITQEMDYIRELMERLV